MTENIKARALEIIGRQRQLLQSINANFETKLPQWKDRTIRFLRDMIVQDELRLLAAINADSWGAEKRAYLEYLDDLEQGLKELPQHYISQDPLPPQKKRKTAPTPAASGVKSNRVFVVHGHDSLAKTDVARTLEKLNLEAIVLHEQPNEGKTIIEKLERDVSQVGFAVVLLTPDDEGYPKNKPDEKKQRARQNVILELGFFSGVLGRSNVCVLYKGDVEIPSDYLGVVYVAMDEDGAWRFNLAKELKRAGLFVDLNKLV